MNATYRPCEEASCTAVGGPFMLETLSGSMPNSLQSLSKFAVTVTVWQRLVLDQAVPSSLVEGALTLKPPRPSLADPSP